MRRFALGCSALLLLSPLLHAQPFTVAPCGDSGSSNNGGGWFFGHRGHACELRQTVLPFTNGLLSVAGINGGIEVTGEDRRDIALEARVTAQDSNENDAVALLHRIQIETQGTIRATGPTTIGWSSQSWSVSYRLRVPRHLAAQLHTENGSIELTDLDGSINAETTNGPLNLANLAGTVHARTVNGGLDVRLAGNQWHGGGLDARSTNGGVSVKASEHYSAHLVADTVNGGISVDLPVAGEGHPRHHLDANLGQGGATLHLQTVNGGIEIEKD